MSRQRPKRDELTPAELAALVPVLEANNQNGRLMKFGFAGGVSSTLWWGLGLYCRNFWMQFGGIVGVAVSFAVGGYGLYNALDCKKNGSLGWLEHVNQRFTNDEKKEAAYEQLGHKVTRTA